jgi:signal transduction histidine kinase
LRGANERLRELDSMKDDFISTVTHELRTPLTSIRALSEMLHEDPEMELPIASAFSASSSMKRSA